MPNKVQITVFEDAERWLKDNLADLHVDNISTVYPLTEAKNLFRPNGFIEYEDKDSETTKRCTLQDHVNALQLLSEKVGKTLFVGGITSPLALQDAGNWDIEVADAFYQIVMLREVVYG